MKVNIDKNLGPYIPEMGWYPLPSYLLRRNRILSLLRDMPKGKVLEVGCGAGTLLQEIAQKGWSCTGYDLSADTVALARQLEIPHSISFYDTPQKDWVGKFDYLLAFEVLEHIEDDEGALRTWLTWLKPGGVLLVSSPNHSNKWTYSDELAGHIRRYSRQSFSSLLQKSGTETMVVETYGFPVGNLAAFVRNIFSKKQLQRLYAQMDSNLSKEEKRHQLNLQSGTSERNFTKVFMLCRSTIGSLCLRIAYLLQRWTKNRSWGEGIIAVSRKP